MNRRRLASAHSCLALAVALSLGVASAHADIVYLKDGRRIGGEVLSEGSRLIRIRTAAGRIETVKKGDVDRIEKGVDLAEDVDFAERDAPFMPGLDESARKAVRAEAKRFSGPLGLKLDAAARPRVSVFGDHPQVELSRVAAAAQRTYDDFVDVFGCDPGEPLSATDAEQIYVFQFKQEREYLRFTDRVFDRMRDETVDDRRLALMRRQKGYWVITPRPLMARYQGPGTLQTVESNTAHLTSHELLMLYRPAGAWMPWWFLEGFATWQEIRLTGFNLTYCIEVAKPGDYYDEKGIPEADEKLKAKFERIWRRKVKAAVARRDDKDLPALAGLALNEINLEDVQQSWSLVDWMSRTDKLVAFTHAYKEKRDLDEACLDVFGAGALGTHQLWRDWVLKRY